MEPLPAIAAGVVRAYYCFDIADTIDLPRLTSVSGEGVDRAPLQLRPAASADFIQFEAPPLIVRLPDDPTLPGATLRAKLFDYGVVSVRITFPYEGAWAGFTALARRIRGDATIASRARAAAERLAAEIASALNDPHEWLVEDYYIFGVERFTTPVIASELTSRYGQSMTQLLLGEERLLDPSEQAESVRVNFAYYDDECAIVQWDTAFVYDRGEGSAATEDILEFANTQLVELRTYDAQLDAELDRIYALEPGLPTRRFLRRRSVEAAAQVRYLLIEVLELSDRASNALKFIGDAYYARLYRGVAGRLGLAEWQRQVNAKLSTVEEMYRVFQDQAQHARGEFLELIVIALIVMEVVIGVIDLSVHSGVTLVVHH